MTFVVLMVLAVVAAVVVGGVALARHSTKSYAEDNVIVPGVDTGAPSNWAGAHSVEARLHRRIRDAVRALRANVELGEAGLDEQRARLEQEAVGIDRRLVAAAALPESVRVPAMEKVEAAVVALEQAAADAALGAQLTEESVIGDTTEAITGRLRAVAEARAELDEEFPTAPPHEVAEQVIDPDPSNQDPGS